MPNNPDLESLQKQVAALEDNALAEEQQNVAGVYAALQGKHDAITIPYPEIGKYTTAAEAGIDLTSLQYMKEENMPAWDRRARIYDYLEDKKLCVGHLQKGTQDYYFLDSACLETMVLPFGVKLVNTDDANYTAERNYWLYPKKDSPLTLSRDLTMSDKQVTAVHTRFDKSNELYSKITDSYLQQVLLARKGSGELLSIIQTIQEKQDNIRMLPLGNTFAVQGCAGSGKTMVLLHRLRYLRYNNMLPNGQYLFLVPGNAFKRFILKTANSFGISPGFIVPYQGYYRYLLGEKATDNDPDVNELVFPAAFLRRVYSEDLVRECYREVFSALSALSNELIGLCDSVLSSLIVTEEEAYQQRLVKLEDSAFTQVWLTLEPLFPQITVPFGAYADIPQALGELSAKYRTAKAEFDVLSQPDYEITIADDDPRLLANAGLAQYLKSIREERILLDKASVFTKSAHKRKLAQLLSDYLNAKDALVEVLKQQDRQVLLQKAAQLSEFCPGVTLETAEACISNATSQYHAAAEKCRVETAIYGDMEAYISSHYAKHIEVLEKFIALSGETESHAADYISALKPATALINSLVESGRAVYSAYAPLFSEAEQRKANEDLKLFASARIPTAQNINARLLNICRAKLNAEFSILLNKKYKHYCYLRVYFRYLAYGGFDVPRYRYIFADEAQDLSPAELELIYKINRNTSATATWTKPVVNLFGDTNQVVTEHGLHDWSTLSFIPKQYELTENFRNTNQIVAYCNSLFPFRMQEIGVDMDPVCHYESLRGAATAIGKDPVFIVKDDYAEKDLQLELANAGITGYTIYTVKHVKGLEFKEVYVFPRDMTDNEKYIAFTRPLAKLNVIHDLRRIVNGEEVLYEQGNDTEE